MSVLDTFFDTVLRSLLIKKQSNIDMIFYSLLLSLEVTSFWFIIFHSWCCVLQSYSKT